MYDYTGWIVRATAGRDRDGLFLVVGVSEPYLLLADGKRRKAAHPKRKKLGHVDTLDQTRFQHPAIGKLKQGQPVSDRELRQALAACKEGITLG